MSDLINTFPNTEYRVDLCDVMSLVNYEIFHQMKLNFVIFQHFDASEIQNISLNWIIIVNWIITDFDTRAHVFFKRNTALLVNAAQICKTPLKLCKHLQISATAAHFSIDWIRVVTQGWVRISETTNRDVWKINY